MWDQPLFKPASAFIGLRYFFAGQRSALLVSFISLLAIAGLVLGVALLIIVLSVMNGFDRELRDNILSMGSTCAANTPIWDRGLAV